MFPGRAISRLAWTITVRGSSCPWRSRISGAPLRKELRAAPHPGHASAHRPLPALAGRGFTALWVGARWPTAIPADMLVARGPFDGDVRDVLYVPPASRRD